MEFDFDRLRGLRMLRSFAHFCYESLVQQGRVRRDLKGKCIDGESIPRLSYFARFQRVAPGVDALVVVNVQSIARRAGRANDVSLLHSFQHVATFLWLWPTDVTRIREQLSHIICGLKS